VHNRFHVQASCLVRVDKYLPASLIYVVAEMLFGHKLARQNERIMPNEGITNTNMLISLYLKTNICTDVSHVLEIKDRFQSVSAHVDRGLWIKGSQ